MKKSGIIAIIVIVAFTIFAIVTLAMNKSKIEESERFIDRSKIPVAVSIEKASKMELTKGISRPAVIEPNEIAGIAASMPGRLESFSIDLGTKVTKGQVIGKVDTKTLDVQRRNLQLMVDKMKTDHERNTELYEGNALSETQFLDSKFGYESRKLELAQLDQQISDSYITSPLTGVITDKRNVVGEFIGAGTPIAEVVEIDPLKIYVYLNQSEVRFISLHQEVNVTSVIFPDKVFKGKVSFISPNVDANYNYKVEIKISTKDYPELRSGTYTHVSFKAESEESVLQIPKKALVEGVKNAYVYIQEGDRAVRKSINVGRENGEYIEVVGGLKEGDRVVVDGQINIVDNSLIQAKE